MKKTSIFTRILSAVVCIVLIAAMGLVLTSCGKNKTQDTASNQSVVSVVSEVTSLPGDEYGSAIEDVGSGETVFIFRVTDADGNDKLYRVRTDKKTVGDALQKIGLIEGEEGDYGLYVKKVNGIEADYDKDQTYWAFYIDNEYAMTGVDSTEITYGAEYCFKIEK